MEIYSKEQILEIYKSIFGLSEDASTINGEPINIFDLLNIYPDCFGNTRNLTPYEILSVPPKFTKTGEEIPIIFAIKHRVNKINKSALKSVEYTYLGAKSQEKDITLTLIEQYKQAVYNSNEEEAERILEVIESVTGKSAREILSSFYDYTKYYKKIKRQLLIDIFSHFFLKLINSSKTKNIKNGLVIKNKIFKPYKDKQNTYKSDDIEVKITLDSFEDKVENIQAKKVEEPQNKQSSTQGVESRVNLDSSYLDNAKIDNNSFDAEKMILNSRKNFQRRKSFIKRMIKISKHQNDYELGVAGLDYDIQESLKNTELDSINLETEQNFIQQKNKNKKQESERSFDA